MKVLIVFGTRPEAIKMAPLIHALRADTFFDVITCSTGQHREMLDEVLHFFQITPNYELDVMTSNQSLASLTARISNSLDKILESEAPDLVIVQGDTTSTFVASLCAFYRRIPVAHVEAGLRSGNRFVPFPEEVNRVLTTILASVHFAPTLSAVANLESSGVEKCSIHLVGNTVVDALLWTLKQTEDDLCTISLRNLPWIQSSRRIILVTAHRRESFGRPMTEICSAIKKLSQSENIEVAFPVHRNPNVRDVVHSMLSGQHNVHLMDPLSYPDLVWLMGRSYLILTDSGGIQEEAPSLKVPVLVMRDVTERLEAVEAGVTKLVGTTSQKIEAEVKTLLGDSKAYASMAKGVNPYGDGTASIRIAKILKYQFRQES